MTKILAAADFLGTVVVGAFKKVFTIMLLTAVLAALIAVTFVLLVANLVT